MNHGQSSIMNQSEVRLHSGHTVHFHPSLSPRPSFWFFFPRVLFRDYHPSHSSPSLHSLQDVHSKIPADKQELSDLQHHSTWHSAHAQPQVHTSPELPPSFCLLSLSPSFPSFSLPLYAICEKKLLVVVTSMFVTCVAGLQARSNNAGHRIQIGTRIVQR